jgi:hypothetical protein
MPPPLIQLQVVIEFLQTLAFGVEDAENNLQHPRQFKYCQHGIAQHECTVDPSYSPCLTPDDVKYRMTRLTMDCVDLYLVESGTALNVQVRYLSEMVTDTSLNVQKFYL